MSLSVPEQSVARRDRFADLFPLPLRTFAELFVHHDNPPDFTAVFSARVYKPGFLKGAEVIILNR